MSARTWARRLALATFIALAGLVYVRHFQAITQIEAATAAQTTGPAIRSLMATSYLMLSAFVCALAALALAGVQTRREFRRRTAAEAGLRRANQEIEARVHERTSDLIETNARLEISERRVRLIAECGVVHLFTMHADGATEYTTSGFEAVTGLDAARSVGLGWMDAVHAEDRPALAEAWRDGVRTRAPFEVIFRFCGVDGGSRWFKMRVSPVVDHGERVVNWVGAAIDMHDQEEIAMIRADVLRREQAARADAELANRLKDDFLATVSHELRTPLNAIVGWVHLLKTGIAEDRSSAVDAIERNAFAQARLIDDLLDVSRMVKGRFTLTVQPVDLRVVVDAAVETLRPAAEARHVDVVTTGDAEVMVSGDAARLQQVAWNLLSNAVKFTPRGGRVTVDVARVGSRARLRVTDTGDGIDPAFLPHVFEPFRQGLSRSARLGLGLGLAIVRQIVELHGGTVGADSDRHGSVFTVMLPIAEASGAEIAAADKRRATAPVGVRVLVAEDDEDSATTLGALLTHRGCSVRTARSARECLQIVDEWFPDVLLCDIGLPDEDGYSLLRRLRDRHRDARPVPAIALTAFAREEDRSRALSAGFFTPVSKPFDADHLVGEIVRAVGARTS